ncbi:MAG: N-acetylmuramoyl-L-alanine amidase [Candidatus Shapirobacteria bacterium]|nr:N-acetylmuramoyl-L-alanine amidase [Candidatus Shapirobacteria bacterium]
MAKKVLIIVGHQNIKFNSIVSLRGNTGTDGELKINLDVGNLVSSMCRERGISVVQTDANANDDKSITSQDFNLALALHCDMDVANDQGGGMCGSGDPSVDMSWQESLRIKGIFDATYFPEVKIVNKNIVTYGMKFYYMWKYLSPKTPCVLLEMGQAKDPHDSVLLGNTKLIATGIVKSICKALNVSYEIETPTASQYTVTKIEFDTLKGQFDDLKRTLDKRIIDFPYSIADCEAKCQEKLLSYKKELVKIINS